MVWLVYRMMLSSDGPNSEKSVIYATNWNINKSLILICHYSRRPSLTVVSDNSKIWKLVFFFIIAELMLHFPFSQIKYHSNWLLLLKRKHVLQKWQQKLFIFSFGVLSGNFQTNHAWLIPEHSTTSKSKTKSASNSMYSRMNIFWNLCMSGWKHSVDNCIAKIYMHIFIEH